MNAYRLLLRLAPRRFRETHRAEMEALFRHRLTEARSRGRTAAAMVWLYAALDILRATPTHLLQRWRRRGRVGMPRERQAIMIGSDFRHALRALAHQKWGSSLVVAMLALGIGANVAVFSLINGLFLKPLPFPSPERLAYLNETAPRWNLERTGITYADFVQWQKAQQAFESIALFDLRSFNVATEAGADRMDAASVTADFARVLGIDAGHLTSGHVADVCVFDPEEYWKIEPAALKSQGKNSPFLGLELKGKVRYTLVEGQVVYEAR